MINIDKIIAEIPQNVTLVAVSKLKPNETILEAYSAGLRQFGENYVQELVDKQKSLPNDIQWHFIGHLQTNKAKFIVPFVSLIHSIDSLKLLHEVNKQAAKIDRKIDCLLQVHIAQEETKTGFDASELLEIINNDSLDELQNIRIIGLMGMSTNTEDIEIVKQEFLHLKSIFDDCKNILGDNFHELSMGMSGDYKLAIECGSSMVRIGSAIFGNRN